MGNVCKVVLDLDFSSYVFLLITEKADCPSLYLLPPPPWLRLQMVEQVRSLLVSNMLESCTRWPQDSVWVNIVDLETLSRTLGDTA